MDELVLKLALVMKMCVQLVYIVGQVLDLHEVGLLLAVGNLEGPLVLDDLVRQLADLQFFLIECRSKFIEGLPVGALFLSWGFLWSVKGTLNETFKVL